MLARLNEDTKVFHAEADAEIDTFLLRDPITASGYRTYLMRLYGFLIPYEAALADTPGLDELIDVRTRANAAMVLRDLVALGMTGSAIGALPQCESLPGFRGVAQALGWMYVVERPQLASGVIKRHLAVPLGAEMARGSAYLSSHTGSVGRAWRELGEAMDQIAATPVIADRIVAEARTAFRCLRRWRTIEQVETIPLAV